MPPLPPPLVVSCPAAHAAIFDHGAHVASWAPAGHDDVLWMSSRALLDSGSAIRGGIPIVFPWFGSGRTGHLSPAHGFARRTTWALADVLQAGDEVLVTHVLTSHDVHDASFPFDFVATHTAQIGETLDLALTVDNTGGVPFSFEEAFHTYLSVGDVAGVRVVGLEGVEYLDQAAENGPAHGRQAGDLAITMEVDRIYASTSPVTVIDPSRGRVITVSKRHSADTVVWNPWIQKAGSLPDVGDGEWRTMLCIEGANVRDHAVSLAAGESHTMGYTVSVAPITRSA